MDEFIYDESFNESDDELLASTDFIDSIETSIVILPHFTCYAADKNYKEFHKNSFICNQHFNSIFNQMKLFNFYKFNGFLTGNLLSALFQKSRVNLQYLDISTRSISIPINNQKSYADIRMEITEFLSIIIYLIKDNKLVRNDINDGLTEIFHLIREIDIDNCVQLLGSMTTWTDIVLKSPSYHLLHGKLEWQWLHLNILLELDIQHVGLLIDTEFESQLKLLINDLITMSIHKLNKIKSTELTGTSPFLCNCVKEEWLLIQLIIEKLNRPPNNLPTFWIYFNKSIETLRNDEKLSTKPINWIQFSIWLMANVSMLQKYDKNGHYSADNCTRIKDNYELLQTIVTKQFLNTDATEIELRIHLALIAPLLCDLWKPSIDVVMIYWECFHSKLNSSFYIPGSSLKNLPVVNLSPRGYLNQIKSRSDIMEINRNDTSFDIFLLMLRKSLQRFDTMNGLNQAKKILGRITVKFSTGKLVALNETGIHNISSLLITLMLPFHIADYTERIQNFLLQISLNRLTQSIRQIAIMRSHISMLILCFEKNFNCINYITKIFDQLMQINMQPSFVQCLRLVADGFVGIFLKATNFDKGEHLLIDNWIIEYLNASIKECNQVLECINSTICKISSTICTTMNSLPSDNHQLVLSAIYRHILPYVKQIWSNKIVTKIVPELAANLCCGLDYVTSNIGYRFDELFKFFIETKCANIQTIVDFLTAVLSNSNVKRDAIKDSVIIRHWIRCCFWSDNNNENLKELTKIVVTLDEFRQLYNGDAMDLINADKPLFEFFPTVSNAYAISNDKYKIAEKMHSYLLSIDDYKVANEFDEQILRTIVVIICHCSPIIYIRAKPMCFFNVAMTQYILTNDILMEKECDAKRSKIMHELWPDIINGIEKLDYRNDGHIKNLLINMIVKWLPNFQKIHSHIAIVSKPLIKCIQNMDEKLVKFIYETISTTFLPVKRSNAHRHSYLILTIFIHVFGSICQNDEKMYLFLNCCLMNMFEHAMFIEERAVTHAVIFDLFATIFKSNPFRLSVRLRQIVTNYLKIITTNNLSYYSSFYFVFMQKLAKINKNIIEDVLEHLEMEIQNLEKLRSVQRDEKLRNNFTKLREIITNG